MKNRFLSMLVLCSIPSWSLAQEEPRDTSVAGNAKVEEIIRSFEGRGVMRDASQPTPAENAVKQFDMKSGFEIDLVASEPEVSQPLFLSWDSRGRMWTVQYRQYQFPAGLRIIRYDQHLRAVFDKTPEPPPRGVRGADKITVHEDTDGDGIYDTTKDVITGLNIATSVQTGRGGIWVLNPPYLLFYPDADGDDDPDGDPEVHLSGFGLQDTHAVANSLLWGPDGWLYGSNGSTTIGNISSAVTKGVRFQGQCVWRYHPTTKVFEVYAEGGGNTFSLDIDSMGRVFSGTNSSKTRGLYYPQGSYSEKNWGKHGPLTNQYAFGYFRHMKSDGDPRRFAQAFTIYEGGLFSKELDGTIIAPNSLINIVWNSRLIREGSGYRTTDLENLAESPDRWFRPVYSGVGPDGAVYLADWYDTRLSHVSPVDDWHKESGRVYRIRPKGTTFKYHEGDLAKLDCQSLIAKFAHPNKWVRQRAMLELGWRGDHSVEETLVAKVNGEGSLESLWALNLLERLTIDRAIHWLSHSDPHIRRWVVRILGDRHEGHAALAEMARTESDIQVRSQLAATAKRVDTEYALPVIVELLKHDRDVADIHMPLMNWWAVEAHCGNWHAIRTMLADKRIWQRPMFQTAIAGQLVQRYATAGSPKELQQCAELVAMATNSEMRGILIKGLNRAFQGRTVPTLPVSLDKALADYQASLGNAGIVLAVRQGRDGAAEQAIAALSDSGIDLGIRIELIRAFGDINHPEAVGKLLALAIGRGSDDPALQRVALQSLSQYDDAQIPTAIVKSLYSSLSEEHNLRDTACRTLASRKTWALALLVELNEWRLRKEQVPADVIQQLRTYRDKEIVAAVEKAFGTPISDSAPEKIAEINRLTKLVAGFDGNAKAGKAHFTKVCANCHKLFGEGNNIGPVLDPYDRGNPKFWVPAIVAPSLEIREGYQSYLALTTDGRVVVGMVVSQDPQTITIRKADHQSIVINRDDLEEFQAIKTSLMPDGVLKDMTDAQIKDLFAYLTLGAKR